MAKNEKRKGAEAFGDLLALLEPMESAERARLIDSVLVFLGDPKVATEDPSGGGGNERKRSTKIGTLAKYIRDCGAEDKPSLRMLAVASWLHAKGNDQIALSDVTKAITDAKQKRLSNPSAFLKSNTSAGYIEGNSDSFYVTDEGREKLGLSD